MAPSATFLTVDASNHTRITGDAVWTSILASESLEKSAEHIEANGDADLTIVSKGKLGQLAFSSDSNNTAFNVPLPPGRFKCPAWIGDALGSAVLLLSEPFPASPWKLSTVLTAFSIDISNYAKVPDFLKPFLDADVLVYDDKSKTAPLNALWCVATSNSYQSAMSLSVFLVGKNGTMVLNQAIQWTKTAIGAAIKSSFSGTPTVVLTVSKLTKYSLDGKNPSVDTSLSFRFKLPGSFGDFECSLDFSKSATTLFLRPTESLDITNTSIFSTIGDALDTDGLPSSQLPSQSEDNMFTSFFNKLDIWYIIVSQDETTNSKKLHWEIGILAGFTTPSGKPILVGFSYDSTISSYTGRLITQATLPTATKQRLPSYDRRLAVPASSLKKLGISEVPNGIDLWDLFGGQGADHGTPPDSHRQLLLKAASVGFSTASKTKSVITLSFAIENPLPSNTGRDEAPSPFHWNEVTARATIIKVKAQGSATATTSSFVHLFSSMTLSATNDPSIPSADLELRLDYASAPTGGAWTLTGSVRELSAALIADWFDADTKSGALDVLRDISLKDLEMTYAYQKGKASSFLISATIGLGKLELDLSYQYVSTSQDPAKPTAAAEKWAEQGAPENVKLISSPKLDATGKPTKAEWAFEAYLHASGTDVDVAGVVDGFKPGAGSDLPDFIGGIKIAVDKEKAPVRLRYSGDDASGSVLTIWLEVGPFNLTFIQFRTKARDPTQPPTVKRLLRISADQIPFMNKVPLVNELPQPFDHLLYLWVEDLGQPDPNLKGFTKAMLGNSAGGPTGTGPDIDVNSELDKMSIPPILVKESQSTQGRNLSGNNVVLKAGSHFMLVTNGKVVLDHVFSAKSSKPAGNVPRPANSGVPRGGALALNAPGTPAATGSSADDKGVAPVTKGDTNAKAGPLSISSLSVQYKDNHLLIGVDATLVLGPLTFGVQGFVISINLQSVKLNDLSAIISQNLLSVSIHGLEAGVSKPPLTIKGAFVHDKDIKELDGSTSESYRGGVAVGLKAWNILAIGEYKIVTPKTGPQFKSVFIYGKLDGPLVTLEFATISGVRVGFGYNSAVRLPQADQLYNFPFISDGAVAGTGNDPMKVLNMMLKPAGNKAPYVFAKDGGSWFCAGMTISCFDCIKLTAVLLFDVATSGKDKGVVIALLADGIFQMPPSVPDPDMSLFYVELLIKVEMNFTEGYIAADAALAPTSHVYVPQARLTGSGSFYTWFPPNANAGDWVISIGGYHRAFQIPPHYPRPERLGLNFIVGDMIHVVGGAYVAVTPKCAMAGGQLHMSLDVGPVSAYCDVTLDVFINFKPFYFIAEISLSVGVDCEIHFLFIHFHISISLGADLQVWGPDDFGGLAHVDFWFFGFDIRFGGDLRVESQGVSLEEFHEMVLKAGPGGDPPPQDEVSKTNPYIAQHKISLEAGLAPSVPKAEPSANFPNTGAKTTWEVHAGTLEARIDCSFSINEAFLVTDEKSLTQNPISREDGSKAPIPPIWSFPMHNKTGLLSTLYLRIYNTDHPIPALESGWRATTVFKQGSKALWQKYDPKLDPLLPGIFDQSKLSDGSNPTLDVCQAIRLLPPEPHMGYTPILDMDATKAMIAQIFIEGGIKPQPPQTNFLAQAFEPEKDTEADQPQRYGDFAATLASEDNHATTATGLSKAKILGNGKVGDEGAGLLRMCAEALGWDRRPPAEKEGNEVKLPDGSPDGRMEWELSGKPPIGLAKQLGRYYDALPLVIVN